MYTNLASRSCGSEQVTFGITHNLVQSVAGEGKQLDLVRAGILEINDICISCAGRGVGLQHPYFEGGLCDDCKTKLMESMFWFGADGTHDYCLICGSGGMLLLCASPGCNRVYCTGCIGCLVSHDAVETIANISHWQCFLCADHDPISHGLLRPKTDWKQNIVTMFHPGAGSPRDTVPANFERRPIRVLSLFDGIGTGKVILDGLNIKVGAYYACEIDQDALTVTQVHHGDTVTHLGDVTLLDKQKLLKLGPIDLLIGGSPCNDLSIANPARKGLDGGTGLLVYEFFRILQELQMQSQQQEGGRHLFWLFENVASMPARYREKISKLFGCKPALWDAKLFSAQQRPRLFWGNIPGMYCPQLSYPTEGGDRSVDGVLMGNRKAAVAKLRTLTTRGNSLLEGKEYNIFPVRMGGQGDTLWIPELERVFGLPEHYTDVGNLPITRRQKLLGQAWSVPVVKHLLFPLRHFYDLTE